MSVPGALPEAVPGIVDGRPRILASLLAALSLRHSSVRAAAALVLSIVKAVVVASGQGQVARGRQGSVQA